MRAITIPYSNPRHAHTYMISVCVHVYHMSVFYRLPSTVVLRLGWLTLGHVALKPSPSKGQVAYLTLHYIL